MEIGQIVGSIQVNKSFKETRSFEVAAWWEEHEAKPGVYPLKIGYKDQLRPESSEYRLYAEVDAVVVDDYFPALFGGVAVGDTKPKHVGESRKIRVGFDAVDAIDKTGISSRDIDVFVDAKMWPEFLAEEKRRLNYVHSLMPEYWAKYEQNGDDQYDSNVGMVAYIAGEVERFARNIQTLNRKIRFTKASRSSYYNTNTAWAK